MGDMKSTKLGVGGNRRRRVRTLSVGFASGACVLALAACDSPGQQFEKYAVENTCDSPVRVDVSTREDWRNVPDVSDNRVVASGEKLDIIGGRAGVSETIWITVSNVDAKDFGPTVPFALSEAGAEPTSDPHTTRYVFVLDGDLCDAPPS